MLATSQFMWCVQLSTIHESHRWCPVTSMRPVHEFNPWVNTHVHDLVYICFIYEYRFCIPSANHINSDTVEVNDLTTLMLPGSFLHKERGNIWETIQTTTVYDNLLLVYMDGTLASFPGLPASSFFCMLLVIKSTSMNPVRESCPWLPSVCPVQEYSPRI